MAPFPLYPTQSLAWARVGGLSGDKEQTVMHSGSFTQKRFIVRIRVVIKAAGISVNARKSFVVVVVVFCIKCTTNSRTLFLPVAALSFCSPIAVTFPMYHRPRWGPLCAPLFLPDGFFLPLCKA